MADTANGASARTQRKSRHAQADGGSLTPRQAAFVQAYAAGNKTATQAAIEAGYSATSARAQVYDLLRNPGVKAELDGIRERITQQTVYDAAAAFGEAGEAIDLARASGNAHAMVKAVELRARLHGLLTEKVQVESITVDIAAALREARSRVCADGEVRPVRDPTRTIDVKQIASSMAYAGSAPDNESVAPLQAADS